MPEQIVWRQLYWPHPLESTQLVGLLKRLASEQTRRPIVLEIRAQRARVRYLFGSDDATLGRVSHVASELIPGLSLSKLTAPRTAISRGARLQVRQQAVGLDTKTPLGSTRAILEALTTARRDGEETVMQILLGPGTSPRRLNVVNDPDSSWLDMLLRGHRPALPATKATMQSKQGQFGFRSVVRVGALAPTEQGRRALMLGLQSALGTLRSSGNQLQLVRDFDGALHESRTPLTWPTRLSVEEVMTLLAPPIGKESLPGLPSPHPKLLAPGPGYLPPRDIFATSSMPGVNTGIGCDIADRRFHSVILGGTGSGKSTLLRHLIGADIAAGRSVLVIDPKADLVSDVLKSIPSDRQNDVVIINPLDANPVGLNPLVTPGTSPELIADGILAIMKELFGAAFGPRTTDVMHAALLTLAHHGKASLVWLPRLLTDPAFRRTLTSTLNDPVGLGPFWAQFDALSPGQQALAIAPGMSRLRQLLLRPSLTAVLGQVEPRFQLQDLFTKRRIVLVALNKGMLGPEGAKLLGSLIASQVWNLTLAQAAIPQDKRPSVSVYVDEMQHYIRGITDLADALSQSRSLGVAWHLAHQYRAQAPSELLAAIDANARNKVVFGLDANDAAAMAKHAPDLEAIDFQSLGQYEIYARLMNSGKQTGWMSGRTLPPPKPISDPLELRAHSQRRYGAQPSLTDLGVAESADGVALDEPLGRKVRDES